MPHYRDQKFLSRTPRPGTSEIVYSNGSSLGVNARCSSGGGKVISTLAALRSKRSLTFGSVKLHGESPIKFLQLSDLILLTYNPKFSTRRIIMR